MIIGTHYGIWDADAFIASLQQLRQGVVRVLSPDQRGICTGWLITDQLIVVPAFGITLPAPPTGYTCYRHTADGETMYEADLCYLPDRASPSVAIDRSELRYVAGLLRLRQPVPDAALRLSSRAVEVGAKVLLLHFPNGNPFIGFSIGQVTVTDETILRYDADTVPGSSGAPVLIDTEVVGYHHSSDQKLRANEGTTLSGLFQGLRASPVWPEIVAYQRLADVAATEASSAEDRSLFPDQLLLDSALLRAAVQWEFDPAAFSEAERDELETMVIDTESERWILTTDERQRLLRQAGSLEALRNAQGPEPATTPRQAVIDRLLRGSSFDLHDVAESDLPYWLQAVRWFEGIIPGLPTAGEVSQTLERLRIRSQFEPIAGATFRGRTKELADFKHWFDQGKPGPLVVSGIGGMGKSSLIARFATHTLPEDTLLLWLDFDRADIIPDDAPSVLTVLGQQAALQLSGFDGPDLSELTKKSTQPLTEADKEAFGAKVQQATVAMGQALARHVADKRPPLLVLDGFEVAQYRQRYAEIGNVMETLLKEVPSLRIIVSGRAPVRDLTLGGRQAELIKLTGIADADADAWLEEQDIADAEVRAQVIRVARRIPLNLRLAVRLAKAEGDLRRLPDDLRENMVSAYLYDRILDRVIDETLKPVVEAILVLRKITPTLLGDLLTDTVPASAGDTFDRLARELAVVDPNAVFSSQTAGASAERTLWIRPDLRSATLRLLETDKPDRVRDLDQRAANWYAARSLTDDVTSAELVYHRLRLSDTAGAKAAWKDGCMPYLSDAEDDLWPDDKRARNWLRKQLIKASTPANTLLSWEKETLAYIQKSQSRGLDRNLGNVLLERTERSKQSPLRFYDAWLQYQQGNLASARALLEQAAEIDGPSGRDQAVLAAQLAVLANDRPAADKMLTAVDNPDRWADRPQGKLEALAVRAARIRLTVDLDEEFTLADWLMTDKTFYWQSAIQQYVSENDVVLPPLRQRLSQMYNNVYESASIPAERVIPYIEQNLSECRAEMLNVRRIDTTLAGRIAAAGQANAWRSMTADERNEMGMPDLPDLVAESIFRIAQLSRQRIDRVTEDLFLMEAVNNALHPEPLQLSIAGTLAALHGWNFQLVPNIGTSVAAATPETTLNTHISLAWNQYVIRKTLLPTQQGVVWAERMVQTESYNDEIKQWIGELRQQMDEGHVPIKLLLIPQLLRASPSSSLNSSESLPLVLLYLLSPDPLETLCRRLLFLPETFQFQIPPL